PVFFSDVDELRLRPDEKGRFPYTWTAASHFAAMHQEQVTGIVILGKEAGNPCAVARSRNIDLDRDRLRGPIWGVYAEAIPVTRYRPLALRRAVSTARPSL